MHRAIIVTFAAFWALAASGVAEAKRVAFVVGINIYDNLAPNQQLDKARNDARSVAATFKDVGFQVILAEDAGRTAFLRAWQTFLDTVEPGDVTALYFSGHGVEINGSHYLLVRDIPQAADGEEVLKNCGIRLQSLIDRLKEQRAQVSIYIIDACRDSPYAAPGRKARPRFTARAESRGAPQGNHDHDVGGRRSGVAGLAVADRSQSELDLHPHAVAIAQGAGTRDHGFGQAPAREPSRRSRRPSGMSSGRLFIMSCRATSYLVPKTDAAPVVSRECAAARAKPPSPGA